MFFCDLDGTLQTAVPGTLQTSDDDMFQILDDSETFDTSVSSSEAQIDVLEGSLAESLVSGENVKSGAYNDAMLVLSVVQLFVLIVIAIFTIVRRTNND